MKGKWHHRHQRQRWSQKHMPIPTLAFPAKRTRIQSQPETKRFGKQIYHCFRTTINGAQSNPCSITAPESAPQACTGLYSSGSGSGRSHSLELKLIFLCLWNTTCFIVLKHPTGSLNPPHSPPSKSAFGCDLPRHPLDSCTEPFPSMALLHRGNSSAWHTGPFTLLTSFSPPSWACLPLADDFPISPNH